MIKSENEEAWTAPMEKGVYKWPGGWSIEVALDLDGLGIPLGSQRIGFNLGRGYQRGALKSRAFWQPLLEHGKDSFGVLIVE